MKNLDYIIKSSKGVLGRIINLETRVNDRECFTKLKNYTTTEMNAIENPEVGYMIFNTTANAPYVYKSGGWAAV